ncbi:MAG: hypothetical protein ACPW61_08675 [Methyloligella sp. ZOD6]
MSTIRHIARNAFASGPLACLAGASLLAGCSGPQSALDPAGYDAERLSTLFWVMTLGSGLIWLTVMGLALYAAWRTEPPKGAANLLILGGGLIFSIAVLTGLLIYGLSLMAVLRGPGT